jgi:hypothetical protein
MMPGEGVKRRAHVAGQPVEHGGEQGGLGAEVLEDDRLGHPDPRGHVGHLPRAVAADREHLGGRLEDGLPPLPGGQPGAPRPPGLAGALHSGSSTVNPVLSRH